MPRFAGAFDSVTRKDFDVKEETIMCKATFTCYLLDSPDDRLDSPYGEFVVNGAKADLLEFLVSRSYPEKDSQYVLTEMRAFTLLYATEWTKAIDVAASAENTATIFDDWNVGECGPYARLDAAMPDVAKIWSEGKRLAFRLEFSEKNNDVPEEMFPVLKNVSVWLGNVAGNFGVDLKKIKADDPDLPLSARENRRLEEIDMKLLALAYATEPILRRASLNGPLDIYGEAKRYRAAYPTISHVSLPTKEPQNPPAKEIVTVPQPAASRKDLVNA